MAPQDVATPLEFYVEDLEQVLSTVRAAAGRMSAEQRWSFADVVEKFTASVEPFRFMDLAPELRNRIYAYCVCSKGRLLFPSACKHTGRKQASQPPITRVSHQVREESLSLFYKLNKFEAHIYRCNFIHFIKHADTICTSGISKIANIIFTIEGEGWEDMCGAGLLEMVCWFAKTDLHMVSYEVDGDVIKMDKPTVLDAINLGVDLYNADVHDNHKVGQSFGLWLRERCLVCRCPKGSKRCSKFAPDSDSWWVCKKG